MTQSLDTKRGGVDDNEAQAGHLVIGGGRAEDDDLLPLGQDSARYKAIGNGVATPCAEWIAHRLMGYMRP